MVGEAQKRGADKMPREFRGEIEGLQLGLRACLPGTQHLGIEQWTRQTQPRSEVCRKGPLAFMHSQILTFMGVTYPALDQSPRPGKELVQRGLCGQSLLRDGGKVEAMAEKGGGKNPPKKRQVLLVGVGAGCWGKQPVSTLGNPGLDKRVSRLSFLSQV